MIQQMRISIHAARVGCDGEWIDLPCDKTISIHAAQEGCDKIWFYGTQLIINFNPRSPRGLRLTLTSGNGSGGAISIHAAQEGCDADAQQRLNAALEISIHAAQEGCDQAWPPFSAPGPISIHAALEGCDASCMPCSLFHARFQSTQPKRAATTE